MRFSAAAGAMRGVQVSASMLASVFMHAIRDVQAKIKIHKAHAILVMLGLTHTAHSVKQPTLHPAGYVRHSRHKRRKSH